MKQLIRKFVRLFGFDIVRHLSLERKVATTVPDLAEADQTIISTCLPFTATGIDRVAALIEAVSYIVENKIPGDITECGVWRGGSMMAIALTLLARGDRSRHLYLYDTFEGMSEPTGDDKSLDGVSAEFQLNRDAPGTGVWCYASIEDVRTNLLSTGYPEDKIHLIKGKVEDTIPQTLPPSLSLLRLDTDWYESTRHELVHLYPLLNPNGILLIDDYGHWQGARKAVDEYFKGKALTYFHRIDYTGRLLVKTAS